MKKWISTLLFLLAKATIYSLPIGNPTDALLYSEGIWRTCTPCYYEEGGLVGASTQGCFRWTDICALRFGYYGDFVFNRNMRIDGKGLDQAHIIRSTEINTNAAVLTLNLWQAIDLYGTVGVSDFRIETNEKSWILIGQTNGVMTTDSHLSWSVGGRGVLWSWRCFNLGFEGQYFQSKPLFRRYISEFLGFITQFNKNNQVTYHEWQVGGTLSYILQTPCPHVTLVPYIGGKYARSLLVTHNFTFQETGNPVTFTIFNLRSHKRGGFAVGSSLIVRDRVGVTVEGRFGDEKAIFVNGQVSF